MYSIYQFQLEYVRIANSLGRRVSMCTSFQSQASPVRLPHGDFFFTIFY